MYSLLNSYVKEKGYRKPWVEKDISQELTDNLVLDYTDVILLLSNPVLDEPVYVSVKDIPPDSNFKISGLTLVEWLVEIDNLFLKPTDLKIPDKNNAVKWMDAFANDFNVTLAQTGKHYTVPAEKGLARDMHISREGLDAETFFNKTLITVNGLLHRKDIETDGLRVLGAGYTLKSSNKDLVGIMDFSKVGDVKEVPIRDRNVFSMNRGEPLKEKVYLNIELDKSELKGKTVLLSIAGFLMIPDNRFLRRCGESVYELDYKNQPWLKRLFSLKEKSCISCLNEVLSRNFTNDTLVSVDELYSDDFIRKLLTLNNSFFIIVDTPELYIENVGVEFNGLAGSYITKDRPDLPLVTGLGFISEYHYHKEYDRYVLTTNDTLLPNYNFETTDWREASLVDSSLTPNQENTFSKGYMLRMYV